MKKSSRVLKSLFAVLLTFAGTIALTTARTAHEFHTGKLVDVATDERLVGGTTVAHAVFQVQVGDIAYFARGEHVRRHGGDPAHGLVVGDQVQVAIDGDNLILKRPDGKEIKAKIVRRQRAEAR
jgi:thiamine monophosphate kinase